jgi:hypothetical protein
VCRGGVCVSCVDFRYEEADTGSVRGMQKTFSVVVLQVFRVTGSGLVFFELFRSGQALAVMTG